MSIQEWIGVAAIVVNATGILVAYLGLSGRISQVHTLINSRMDQMLVERGDAEHAKGVIQGASNAADEAHIRAQDAK